MTVSLFILAYVRSLIPLLGVVILLRDGESITNIDGLVLRRNRACISPNRTTWAGTQGPVQLECAFLPTGKINTHPDG